MGFTRTGTDTSLYNSPKQISNSHILTSRFTLFSPKSGVIFMSIHKRYTFSTPFTPFKATECTAHNSSPENWPFGTNQMGQNPHTVHIGLADTFTCSKSLRLKVKRLHGNAYDMIQWNDKTTRICPRIFKVTVLPVWIVSCVFYFPIPHFHNPWILEKQWKNTSMELPSHHGFSEAELHGWEVWSRRKETNLKKKKKNF